MRSSAHAAANNFTDRGVIRTRVLVVDDEPLIQWSVCAALAAAGFDAVAARTPDEARRVAAELPAPQVVVLDIHPDGAGRELMADLRQMNPACRFLAMSTARRAGAAWSQLEGVQIVEKPFDLAEVVRLVVDSVEQGPLQYK